MSVHGHGEGVADVCAADPEDDIGGDVGGVVGDALKVAGDEHTVEGLGGVVGLALDEAMRSA